MLLKQKIVEDLKLAMKAGDTQKRDVLRMLDSMVKNTEIEKKKREEGLTDEEIQTLVSRAIKQRKDSMQQFEDGGRSDLAEKEKEEISILTTYLPEQLSEEIVRAKVQETIIEMKATSVNDRGKVIGATLSKLKGQTEGQIVKEIVEEELK